MGGVVYQWPSAGFNVVGVAAACLAWIGLYLVVEQ
jgi:hypothetical protein